MTEIREVRAADEGAWKELYRGYREFYRLIPDGSVVDRVWTWLMDPDVEVCGLVAVQRIEGAEVLVGLANHRAFHRPSSGTVGTYLDDLFVRSDLRRSGVGQTLIAHLTDLAAARGHSVVRWFTSEDNLVARSLYDRVAERTRWVTYDVVVQRGLDTEVR